MAKIYIGDKLCGTLPGTIEISKLYTVNCDLVGNYVKIDNGRPTNKVLGFAEVEVYAQRTSDLHKVALQTPTSSG